ncbi:hypothetical protein AAFF_G00111330 [Aldrovandia affinis]|uniref:Uncharacterized protein n=1 Tax=Aldrovandia affinis TaxID=143900 RepID=A0AAD7WBR8_9TELE|nr:hypothetical protein AAFF_G00111330 [Aldrovandia affinis]
MSIASFKAKATRPRRNKRARSSLGTSASPFNFRVRKSTEIAVTCAVSVICMARGHLASGSSTTAPLATAARTQLDSTSQLHSAAPLSSDHSEAN